MQKWKGTIKLWFLSMFIVLGALAGAFPNSTSSSNLLFVSADNPKVAKPTTESTVNVILITREKNCTNCSKVKEALAKVKTIFKPQIDKKVLTFTQYDYDKNINALQSITKPENLPLILIKKDGKEKVRLTGSKTKEEIEKQINNTLSSSPTINEISPSTDISNLDFSEEDNTVRITADIKNTKIVKTVIQIKTTDNKVLPPKTVKPNKGKIDITIDLSGKGSKIFGSKTAYAQSQKVQSVTIEGRDNNDKKIASQSKDAIDSSLVSNDSTDTTPVGNLSNNPIGLGVLYDALRGVSEPLDGAEPDDPKGQLLLRVVGLIQFLFALASVILVLGVIWTGLLYIFSMGNDEQATKAKKGFINLFYGIVLLLVSFTIVSLIRQLIETGNIGF